MTDCKTPNWDPEFWDNLRPQDLQTTNCYYYAFNVVDKNDNPDNKHKIQPGEISNTNKNNLRPQDLQTTNCYYYAFNVVDKNDNPDQTQRCLRYWYLFFLHLLQNQKSYY